MWKKIFFNPVKKAHVVYIIHKEKFITNGSIVDVIDTGA